MGSTRDFRNVKARGESTRSGGHSAKPEAWMDYFEQVSPGPRIELFSRRARLGWQTWGNEALGGTELVA